MAVADGEFLRELINMNAVAQENRDDMTEILKNHPDLPPEVIAYMDLSVDTIEKMAATMGKMGALISRMEDLMERMARDV